MDLDGLIASLTKKILGFLDKHPGLHDFLSQDEVQVFLVIAVIGLFVMLSVSLVWEQTEREINLKYDNDSLPDELVNVSIGGVFNDKVVLWLKEPNRGEISHAHVIHNGERYGSRSNVDLGESKISLIYPNVVRGETQVFKVYLVGSNESVLGSFEVQASNEEEPSTTNESEVEYIGTQSGDGVVNFKLMDHSGCYPPEVTNIRIEKKVLIQDYVGRRFVVKKLVGPDGVVWFDLKMNGSYVVYLENPALDDGARMMGGFVPKYSRDVEIRVPNNVECGVTE